MSPRVNRRRPDRSEESAEESGARPRGIDQVESWPDRDWIVRTVTGAASRKTYRCPGCDNEIYPATPHVVAWPADGGGGPDERRHWHKPCWAAHGRRGVKVHRSSNAPHYG